MKNRIENCNLKTTIQGALCGALTALIVVPFMVLLAHIVYCLTQSNYTVTH